MPPSNTMKFLRDRVSDSTCLHTLCEVPIQRAVSDERRSMSRGTTSLCIAFLLSTGVVAVACGGEPASVAEAPVADSTPQFPTGGPKPDAVKASLCAEARGAYEATREPSNVLFLYDRSGSMHIQLPSKATRWDATKKGFFDLLSELPSSVSAGLMLFPQGDAPVNKWCGIEASINDVHCKSGWPEPSQKDRCDAGLYKASVASNYLSASQVTSLEAQVTASDSEFYWGTPLSTALSAAIATQRASSLPGAKSVILLTDGNPTSCGNEGISNDISHVVEAAAAGLDGNGALVRTFVIGLTDSSRQAAKASNLSPIAVAGGTKRSKSCEKNDSCFYKLTDDNFADDLKKVFDQVSQQAFSCTFNLPSAAGADLSQLNVTLDGGPAFARDIAHKEGWDLLPNGTQIQLYGQACSAMKDSSAKLHIVVGCPAVVVETPDDDIDVR